MVSTQALSLHQLPSCSLGSATGLTLQALGDFPAARVQLDPRSPALSFDSFPFDTRQLRISASFGASAGAGQHTATGLVPLLPPLMPRPVLLLPPSTACVLADPLAFALPGAAAVALADGAVLIAGGLGSDGIASSSVLRLPAGAQLVEQVAEGMLLRRAYASATATGELVVIAGGAADELGSAQDTYEIFDARTALFVATLSKKLVSGPRMQHAAATLRDGRVLLVGGRAAPNGSPLQSAELLDVVSGERVAVSGRAGLRVGRVAPDLLVLDSGDVLVVGGYDASGALVPSVERFDLSTRSFSALTVALPAHAQAVASALPGARFAWLGCAAVQGGQAGGCSLSLQLPKADDFESVDVPLDFSTQAPKGLSELHMLTLLDGRLFVTGGDRSASIAHRAFTIEPSSGTLTARDAVRVPTLLLRAADGTLLELDAFGASLRREDEVSAYDTPSADLVSSGSVLLALDAPSHWQRSGKSVRALVDHARLDVAALQFAAVRVELDVTGKVVLGWSSVAGHDTSTSTSTSTTTVTLTNGALSASGCNATLPKGTQLRVERRAGVLTLGASDGSALCSTAVGSGAQRLWLSADAGSELRGLRVSRL